MPRNSNLNFSHQICNCLPTDFNPIAGHFARKFPSSCRNQACRKMNFIIEVFLINILTLQFTLHLFETKAKTADIAGKR